MCRPHVRHRETYKVPAQSHQTFLERSRECSGMFSSVIGRVLKVVDPNTEQQERIILKASLPCRPAAPSQHLCLIIS